MTITGKIFLKGIHQTNQEKRQPFSCYKQLKGRTLTPMKGFAAPPTPKLSPSLWPSIVTADSPWTREQGFLSGTRTGLYSVSGALPCAGEGSCRDGVNWARFPSSPW